MDKPRCSFAEFLESIRDREPDEIILICREDISQITAAFAQQGSRVTPECRTYLQTLQGFLSFLESPNPALHRYNPQFQAYRPVVETLIKKGRMKKELLKAF